MKLFTDVFDRSPIRKKYILLSSDPWILDKIVAKWIISNSQMWIIYNTLYDYSKI